MTAGRLVGALSELRIDAQLLHASWAAVSKRGRGRAEAEVLWGGRVRGDIGEILVAIEPVGVGVEARANWYRVSAGAHARVARVLEACGCVLLAQVHSHPGTDVSHSPTDDDHPFARDDGFFSIVWPEFARGATAPLRRWGVHEIRGGQWTRLEYAAAASRISVVSGLCSAAGLRTEVEQAL